MSRGYLVLAIAVIVLAGGVLAYALTHRGSAKTVLYSAENQAEVPTQSNQSKSTTVTPSVISGKSQGNSAPQQLKIEHTNESEPPLLLKSIGVNLDYYDPAINKAGDFVFTKEKLQFDRLFMGYGFVIPAGNSSTGADKSNPQPTFVLPLGTKVQALVDGVVADVPTLYSKDFSVMVASSADSRFMYETEHVINPVVKKGDIVKAGQVVAEVSNYAPWSGPGMGIVEIGILKGGNPPQHLCPFAYIDPSIKDDVFKKLTALFKAWEDYRGDPGLYDESNPTPGCLTMEPIEG